MNYSKDQQAMLRIDPDRVRNWEAAKQLVKDHPTKYSMEYDKSFNTTYVYYRSSVSKYGKIIAAFKYYNNY